jgi:hypothetical protein
MEFVAYIIFGLDSCDWYFIREKVMEMCPSRCVAKPSSGLLPLKLRTP